MRMKYYYKLKKINSDEFILYHHLGLGDHIICAGLANYLSQLYKTIYIPVKKANLANIQYLFKDSKNIELFQINESEELEVERFAMIKNLPILKLGFQNMKDPFDTSFYKQIKLPYSISYDYFYVNNSSKKENELKNYILDFYNITTPQYVLVHNETSFEKYKLNIPNRNIVYVSKDSDKFRNIFLYKKLIEDAAQVHCVNSSFLHFVERVDTQAKLFYHEKRIGPLSLSKEWNIIKYEN